MLKFDGMHGIATKLYIMFSEHSFPHVNAEHTAASMQFHAYDGNCQCH